MIELLLQLNLYIWVIQEDSPERGSEYPIVTPIKIKQYKQKKKYTTHLDVCVIDCITRYAGSDLHFLPDT